MLVTFTSFFFSLSLSPNSETLKEVLNLPPVHTQTQRVPHVGQKWPVFRPLSKKIASSSSTTKDFPPKSNTGTGAAAAAGPGSAPAGCLRCGITCPVL